MNSNSARLFAASAASALTLTALALGPRGRGRSTAVRTRYLRSGIRLARSQAHRSCRVTLGVRDRTRQENGVAEGLRDPNGAYGSNSCKLDYAWRNAVNGDRCA